MPKPLLAPMPLGLELYDGYTIRVTAADPTTGNPVAGVIVDEVTIQVETPGSPAALESGPFELVPGPGQT